LDWIAVITLITIGVIAFQYQQQQKKVLYQDVEKFVVSEAATINPPDDLLKEESYPYTERSCNYDNKVGSMRCYNTYTKYYGTNYEITDAFYRIGTYLRENGWEAWLDPPMSETEIQNQVQRGYLPSAVSSKKGKYTLDVTVEFAAPPGVMPKRLSEDENLRKISDEFGTKYKYYYEVRVTSDMIDR
jgi:hypothetical protein